jgi:threonylcarbamoyladenosine tRNA methylthiotransferase MtaB
MRRVFIKTFGCKVNYTESVAFSELLQGGGFEAEELTGSSLPEPEGGAGEAPVVFVNSCCVTQEAERKAAQFARKIRREHPGSEVLFTGCAARNHVTKGKYEQAGARVFDFYAEAYEWLRGEGEGRREKAEGERGEAKAEGVDAASRREVERGSGEGRSEKGKGEGEEVKAEPAGTDVFAKSPAGEAATLFESGIVERARSRAFVKVQDGCHNCCTFCIIPFVRPYASRPFGELLDEVDRRIDEGYRELVLTGVNIGHYGMTPVDTLENIASDKHWRRGKLYERLPGHATFFDLVDAILDRLPDDVRLRISSIEPEDIEERFYEQFRHPRMCPHLHLPLQSGSDAVLSEMRRLYTAREYLEIAEKFRTARPDGALTTDILAGFPTETESHFEQTLALCSALQFERVHAFPYSPRPGTRAARMAQLPRSEIQRRNRRLIEHCAEISNARWQRFCGSECTVLLEDRRGGIWTGHGEAYQQVELAHADSLAPGMLQRATLGGYSGGVFSALAVE